MMAILKLKTGGVDSKRFSFQFVTSRDVIFFYYTVVQSPYENAQLKH